MMDPSASSGPVRTPNGNERMMSMASLGIGIINLCAWLLPICGIPLGLLGIGLGYLGMRDATQKNLAIAGIVLSSLGVLLACGNAVLGAFFGPQLQELINQLGQGIAP